MKKHEILAAISKLIENYKNSVNDHGIRNCPLCQLFFVDTHRADQFTSECTNCPNVAFAKKDDWRGCTQRGSDNHALNFGLNGAQTNLAEFWQKIFDLYVSKEEDIILEFGEELKEEIRMIAMSFNS